MPSQERRCLGQRARSRTTYAMHPEVQRCMGTGKIHPGLRDEGVTGALGLGGLGGKKGDG